jgi:3-methyladenine DNA glycosylase AlkD
MEKLNHILTQLHALADTKSLPGMARFGIDTNGRLGISIPQLRKIAKETGRDHELALALWKTAIPEARILASMVDDPAQVTSAQMDAWVRDFNSWDICDQVCGNLFDKTSSAWEKIGEWAADESEFIRRAGYVMIACLAVHDKNAPDQAFTTLFPIITAGATDARNFVRKAVNWAIRNIGKRNLALNKAAITLSEEILAIDNKTARWIARDALRELTSDKVRRACVTKPICRVRS